jgi:hypothetical protein
VQLGEKMTDEEKLKLRFEKDIIELSDRLKRSVKVISKKEIDKMIKELMEQ